MTASKGFIQILTKILAGFLKTAEQASTCPAQCEEPSTRC